MWPSKERDMDSFRKIFSDRAAQLLQIALKEDTGSRDLTSELLIDKPTVAKAAIYAKERGILCGTPVVEEIFRLLDPSLKIHKRIKEGRPFKKNAVVLTLHGNLRAILKGERTALNFLGHLSGIASLTGQFVQSVKKDSVLILDTRKTLPLLREFEKYAVRIGDGKNHRMGLFDAVLVKENHRRYGDLNRLKRYRYKFEIEVRNLKELHEALSYKPRVILFDNFKPDQLRRAVRIARSRNPEIILEASGGINLDNVAHYAAMGVDCISIGALTHSVRSLDFSLLVE